MAQSRNGGEYNRVHNSPTVPVTGRSAVHWTTKSGCQRNVIPRVASLRYSIFAGSQVDGSLFVVRGSQFARSTNRTERTPRTPNPRARGQPFKNDPKRYRLENAGSIALTSRTIRSSVPSASGAGWP